MTSWYGLTGELEVENELWHMVRVGALNLPHPAVVITSLRAGLPRSDRLRLSFLHEFGHLQTLPVALAHGLILLVTGVRGRKSVAGWILWLVGLLVAREAAWEMASEAYVVLNDGRRYRETYRQHHNPFVGAFWAVMAGLGVGLSWRLMRGRPSLDSDPRSTTPRRAPVPAPTLPWKRPRSR